MLDHILTNEKHKIILFVIKYDFKNNCPVAALIYINIIPKHIEPIFVRSFVKFNCNDFNELNAKLDSFKLFVNAINETTSTIHSISFTPRVFLCHFDLYFCDKIKFCCCYFDKQYLHYTQKAISKTETFNEQTLGKLRSINMNRKNKK